MPTIPPPISRDRSRTGSFSGGEEVNDVKCEIMVNWLHSKQERKLWTMGEKDEGIVLKKSRGIYTCSPASLAEEGTDFFHAVQMLNVKVRWPMRKASYLLLTYQVAMTVNTRVIRILLYNNILPFIEIEEGLHLQVLPSISYLPRCQKHQFAAFVADRGLLIVWDDDPDKIIGRIESLETALVKMIWGRTFANPEENKKEEKEDPNVQVADVDNDLEDPTAEKPRPIVLLQATYTAFTLALTITTLGLGWRQIAFELGIDHAYLRFLFVLAIVPQFWLALVSFPKWL